MKKMKGDDQHLDGINQDKKFYETELFLGNSGWLLA